MLLHGAAVFSFMNELSIECRRLEPAAARTLYQEALPDDFPPAELRPFPWIEALLASGEYRIHQFLHQGQPVAYALLCHAPDQPVWLVDYLAVYAPYRGQGIGSALLESLRLAFAGEDALLFEIDDPAFAEDEAELLKRNRRIAFYQRGGVTDSGVRTCVQGCEFQIFSLPCRCTLSAEALADALDAIYHRLFPASFYKAEVCFHPPFERGADRKRR